MVSCDASLVACPPDSASRFDKLDADLAKAMISLPAAKGFSVGSGFAGTRARGLAHNDIFIPSDDGIATRENRSGGIQGGYIQWYAH